jgi:hypothetical protein
MKSGTTIYYDLVHAIKEEFPDFEVIPKLNSKFMWACYYLGLMRFWNPHFMERYITTAFGKVYMPAELIGTEIGADVLRHVGESCFIYLISYFLYPPFLP